MVSDYARLDDRHRKKERKMSGFDFGALLFVVCLLVIVGVFGFVFGLTAGMGKPSGLPEPGKYAIVGRVKESNAVILRDESGEYYFCRIPDTALNGAKIPEGDNVNLVVERGGHILFEV